MVLGVSISSLSISSNQAATAMMLQKISSCTYQDDKTQSKADTVEKRTALRLSASATEAAPSSADIAATTTKANTKQIAVVDSPTKDDVVVAPGDMIAYGSQGPASNYLPLKERFEKIFPKGTYEFFYDAFEEDCTADGCIYHGGEFR